MPRASFREIIVEKEFWILFLIGLLYFYKPLFLDETFFFRDLYSHFYPHKRLLVDYWNQRALPLWDPYLQGGTPFLGNINNNVLYPSNVLYLILPTVTAFNLDLVLHVIFSTLASYMLARILGFTRTASTLVALIYGYCGYSLSHINLFIRLLSMPYLPLLLMFWHLYLLEDRKRWFVFAVLSGVLQLFAGAAEMTLITLFLAFGWTIFFPYNEHTFLRKSMKFMLLVIFIGSIAAIQVLPTAEMIVLSERWQGMDFGQFSSWSVNPRRLPELILPEFFGRTDTLSRIGYWGNPFEDEDHPYIVSIYFGWIPILLAIAGGLLRSKNGQLPVRVRRFLLIVFFGSILLSLGRHLPLFEFLYRFIPIMSVFRYPVKFLLAGIFPVALLAGYTCDRIFAKEQNRMIAVFWMIAVLMMCLTVMMRGSTSFSSLFQQWFYGEDYGAAAQLWLFHSLLHITLAITLIAIILTNRTWKRISNPAWLMVIIVGSDLLVAGLSVNPLAPREFLTQEPDIVPVIRNEIRDGRLYRVPAKSARLRAPSDDIVWGQRWDLEVLNFFLASFYKIPVIFHDDIYGMASLEQVDLKSFVERSPWNQKLPILSAAGVSLILTSENLVLPDVEKILILQNNSDTNFYLYRNKSYSGRVRFVTLPSSKEDVAQSTSKGPSGVTPCKGVEIQKLHSDLTSSLYRVRNACEGYLGFAEPNYPGWHIEANEKPATVVSADGGFSAVRLAPGDHVVKRYYLPYSFISGTAISALSIGFLVLFSLSTRHK